MRMGSGNDGRIEKVQEALEVVIVAMSGCEGTPKLTEEQSVTLSGGETAAESLYDEGREDRWYLASLVIRVLKAKATDPGSLYSSLIDDEQLAEKAGVALRAVDAEALRP